MSEDDKLIEAIDNLRDAVVVLVSTMWGDPPDFTVESHDAVEAINEITKELEGLS